VRRDQRLGKKGGRCLNPQLGGTKDAQQHVGSRRELYNSKVKTVVQKHEKETSKRQMSGLLAFWGPGAQTTLVRLLPGNKQASTQRGTERGGVTWRKRKRDGNGGEQRGGRFGVQSRMQNIRKANREKKNINNPMRSKRGGNGKRVALLSWNLGKKEVRGMKKRSVSNYIKR